MAALGAVSQRPWHLAPILSERAGQVKPQARGSEREPFTGAIRTDRRGRPGSRSRLQGHVREGRLLGSRRSTGGRGGRAGPDTREPEMDEDRSSKACVWFEKGDTLPMCLVWHAHGGSTRTVMADTGPMVSTDTVLVEFASCTVQRFFMLLSRVGHVQKAPQKDGR